MTDLVIQIDENPDHVPGAGTVKFVAVVAKTQGLTVAARAGGSTAGIAAGRAMRRLVEKEAIR